MDDRFEVGRDLGLTLISTIGDYRDQMRDTVGVDVTVFEIIGVLHMLAADYHDQLRRNSDEEQD